MHLGRATRIDIIREVDGNVDRQVDLTGRERGHNFGELRRVTAVARIRLKRQAILFDATCRALGALANRLAGEVSDADLLK